MARTTFPHSSAFTGSAARSSANRKAGKIARGRWKNKKVISKLKSGGPKKTIRKKVYNNKSAIFTLAKQVKSLQLTRFGELQRQHQSCNLSYTTALQTPLVTKPLAFCVNDFYNGNKIYQGQVNPATQMPQTTTAAQMKKQTFDLDIADGFQWNEKNNQNTVSLLEYLPVYTKLKFTLTGQIRGTAGHALRYRFTLFKTKHLALSNSVQSYAMPSSLGAYWYMCSNDPTLKNYFSKKYHTVLQDKYVTIMPPSDPSGVQKIYRTVEMPFSFGNIKSMRPQITATPASQTVWTNVSRDELIWCLISCNTVSGQEVNINFDRYIVWRDHHQTD